MQIKHTLITLLLAMLSLGTLNAQSLGYNNHRIAISADGNNQADNLHKWSKADPDDWGATPAALAMIAKLGLQDKLVHYSYNNFIAAPPHTTSTNQMKLGVDGGIQYWDFDSSVFFDVPEDNSTAINHLADEIAKSTEADPLYFIHMGPAEFFYLAVKKVVDDGKIESLAHVHVISHSGYNDNHLRRGDPDFDLQTVPDDEKHHTMTEAIALSGDRINYTKIKDQNAGTQPNVLWKSDKDWSVWYWMRDHADPSIQWIYERMLANAKSSADISDAGMVYYLLMGDEDGSPSKFESFIGDGILEGYEDPSTACADITWVGIEDFEMAQIDTFVIPYKDTGRNAVAINAGTYKNRFAASQKIFDGVSNYYNITLTSLTEEDGESTYRIRVNDKLVGEFQNPETEADMEPYEYTFENILVQMGDVIQIESNTHSNGKIPEGDAYAFARGRWRSIAFECNNDCQIEERDGLLIFEAERFELQGQWQIAQDENASGGEYIYYSGPNSYQNVNMDNNISYTFKINDPGNYTVKWMMRQPEGERGTDKGNDVYIYIDDDYGYAGSQQLTHYEKFYSRSGDDFVLHGVAEVHGVGHSWLTAKFPTAGEYTINICGRSHGLQIDRMVLYKGLSFEEVEIKVQEIAETSECGGVVPPSEASIKVLDFPSELAHKQTDFEVRVNYSALEAREVIVSIVKPDLTVLASKKKSVSMGAGTFSVPFELDQYFEVGEGYKVSVALVPIDGSIDQAIVSHESNFNVYEGEAPADKDNAQYIDVPKEITTEDLTVPIKISYSATQARDVNIEVKKDVYITNSLVTVPAGYGDTTIVINFASGLAVYDKYQFILAIRPVGGNWETNITKEVSNFKVVKATSSVRTAESEVKIYPNPVEDNLYFTNNGQVESLFVSDLNGRKLLSQAATKDLNTVDVQLLKKGTYLLNLNLDNASKEVFRIVKN